MFEFQRIVKNALDLTRPAWNWSEDSGLIVIERALIRTQQLQMLMALVSVTVIRAACTRPLVTHVVGVKKYENWLDMTVCPFPIYWQQVIISKLYNFVPLLPLFRLHVRVYMLHVASYSHTFDLARNERGLSGDRHFVDERAAANRNGDRLVGALKIIYAK